MTDDAQTIDFRIRFPLGQNDGPGYWVEIVEDALVEAYGPAAPGRPYVVTAQLALEATGVSPAQELARRGQGA